MIATLFVHPVTLPYWSQLPLLLPLCLAAAIVYKTIRTEDVAKLPREAGLLMLYIVLGLIAAAIGLWVVFWLALR